jgi:hypothetical protein
VNAAGRAALIVKLADHSQQSAGDLLPGPGSCGPLPCQRIAQHAWRSTHRTARIVQHASWSTHRAAHIVQRASCSAHRERLRSIS